MGQLYTSYKIFHQKDKIDSLPENEESILPPVHIRIKPTNICNHNCSYCAYRADDMQLGKDMVGNDYIPKEKMVEIISDLESMGVKAVTFSGGGDPFCYPYLTDAVKKLAKTNIRFASLTNGSRLKGEIAELFASRGTWLRISMDGWDSDSYAAYRGVGTDEFKKVMQNIENFKKLNGKCYLGISVIIDKKNYSHLIDLIGCLKNTGVDSVKLSPCVVSNSGFENNSYHKEIFSSVKEQAEKSISELMDDSFEIYDTYHVLDEKFKKDYEWCPYLQILPIIGADLNIYSCQDKAYNLDCGLIGSIKEKSFKKFWYSDKEKYFNIVPSRDCDHHCVANSKNKLLLEYLSADLEHAVFV